jgi:hypothetical protein
MTGTRDGAGDRAGQREIVAALGAVPIHRSDEQFARAEFGQPHGMLDRVDARLAAAAMREDFPTAAPTALASTAPTTHCAPKRSASSAASSGRATAALLIATLSAPASSKSARILGRTDAAADRERHEADGGGARDDIEDRTAILVRGGDVEEAEFVGAGRVIDLGLFHRIARIGQIEELHALHHAPAGDVEAGNDDADIADGPLILRSPFDCLPSQQRAKSKWRSACPAQLSRAVLTSRPARRRAHGR